MRHPEYIDALLWTFHVHLPALRVTLYFLFSLFLSHSQMFGFLLMFWICKVWEHFFFSCYLTFCSLYLLWLLFLWAHIPYFTVVFVLFYAVLETWDFLSWGMCGGWLHWLGKASSVKFTFSLRLYQWWRGDYSTAAQQRNPLQAPVLTTRQKPRNKG